MHTSWQKSDDRAEPALRRLASETRGAVMVETILFLPILVMAWLAVIFIHDYYQESIAVAARDRACAWAFASRGCVNPPPIECATVARSSSRALTESDLIGDLGGLINVFLQGLPYISNLVDAFFGQHVRTHATGTAMRPPELRSVSSGILQTIDRVHHVPCNPGPPRKTPDVIAINLWCRVGGPALMVPGPCD